MPTKNKTDYTKNKRDTIDPVRAEVTKDTKSTIDIKDINDTRDEFRFSARFTPSQWAFLQEMKWKTRRSITAILQDYVTEDMEKHPEILKTIDELNK